jgi:hypothetical protein
MLLELGKTELVEKIVKLVDSITGGGLLSWLKWLAPLQLGQMSLNLLYSNLTITC